MRRTDVGDGLGRARYPISPAREGDSVFAADATVAAAFNANNGNREWKSSWIRLSQARLTPLQVRFI